MRDLLPDTDIDPRFAGIDVTGVTADSRKVQPGYLFVAIAGAKADGAQFVAPAIAAGAAAIVVEHRPDGLPDSVAVIQVPMRAARWRLPRRNCFRVSRR